MMKPQYLYIRSSKRLDNYDNIIIENLDANDMLTCLNH